MLLNGLTLTRLQTLSSSLNEEFLACVAFPPSSKRLLKRVIVVQVESKECPVFEISIGIVNIILQELVFQKY